MTAKRRSVVAASGLVAAAVGVLEPRGEGQALSAAEAERARARIVVPEGFRVELFAAEPDCANLVALDVDPWGRCYVVETFRRDRQVLDIREHLDWKEDDLACRTVDDRVAMILKHEGPNASIYGAASERVRLLRDRDRDGRADGATLFAGGFDGYADGVAAGVLARRGEVLFADIPNLWRLRDADGDGRAESREVVSTGYGVHFNFVGHDLHGLRVGPDGRLYFSIGDRGLDVVTKEGRRLQLPDTGAVLRCELDGSRLELFHTGLRNPQELAFNDVGDLFTCDNNSDSGDKARLVHVVDGGDSGWSIGWQWIEGATPRGPWNSEKMWHPRNADSIALQPDFIVPCVTNLVNGPSGLTHEPGTCFSSRWRDHFFVCDFEGEWDNSRVVAFAVAPQGATYRLASEEPFVARGIVATDCEFAADGSLYVSDWVGGWVQTNRGRVWRISEPAARAQPIVAETRDLLRQELDKTDRLALMSAMAHADQRVRQEAQLALAARGDVGSLRTIARLSSLPLARLHGVWGLGQIARRGDASAASALLPLLRDRDAEVRAQAARALGDAASKPAVPALIALLKDRSPRCQFFAALALGRIKDPRAVAPLVELIERNADADVYLRHSGVMGLVGCAHDDELVAIGGAASPAARRAALLAMRRRALPQIARFLDDPDRSLVVEAARAIHDVPIPTAMGELALLVERNFAVEPPLLVRSIDANFRLGRAEHAQRLVRVATRRSDLSLALRADALRALTDFDSPPPRDRVLGVWRPCEPGRAPAAVDALRPSLDALLTREDDSLRELAARFVERNRVAGFDDALRALVADPARAPAARVAALDALAALSPTFDDGMRRVTEQALASDEPKLRGAARRVLAKLHPSVALQILGQALDGGTVGEKQDAFATLGDMDYPPATGLIATWLERMAAGEVAPGAALDLLEAAERKRADPVIVERLARIEEARPKDDPLAAWRECVDGGDAARGRAIFFERNDAQCAKCHRVAGEGAGEAGPDLAGIGGRRGRDVLLESIALPNRQIAVGYGNTVFVMKDGDIVDGRVIGETPTHWLLITTDRGTVRVRKSAIATKRSGKSSMPEDLVQRLSRRDVRDLVAWLATLQDGQ